jgi:hypothetical protein
VKPSDQPSTGLEDAPGRKPVLTRRLLWLLWVAAIASFLGVWLAPVSNRITRFGGVLLLLVCWFGLLSLTWRHHRIRIGLLVITGLAAGFLIMPAPTRLASQTLRQDYLVGLRRYTGVTYYWGGESFKGIDCSGLIRRGLIDSAFCRGVWSLNPELVRYAIWLWWHDCSASDLGEEHLHMTVHVLDTPSINRLDHSRILPGDLAVTASGVHIMAYLGSNTWIEADPGAARVITVSAPCETNAWFLEPMKIMRWSILRP